MKKRHLVTYTDPSSFEAEAFRTLRTNIQFLSPDNPVRSLVITSACPQEGKTTVAANLAVTIAQAGRTAILADGDMRRPAVGGMFLLPGSSRGLSGVLAGQFTLEEALARTSVEGLLILPAGFPPPNPSELLASEKMGSIWESLRRLAEVVIFDSPPAGVVTDAAILARRADGCLLVINPAISKREDARRAKAGLEQVHARVLGVVLNRITDHARPEPDMVRYYHRRRSGERRPWLSVHQAGGSGA